jgi:hypothetical protein
VFGLRRNRCSESSGTRIHAVSSLGVFDQEGTFDAAPDDLDFTPLEERFFEKTL